MDTHWNWRQLDPRQADTFEWQYGYTPFSNLWVIYLAWFLYFVGIIGLRWLMAERRRLKRDHPLLLVYNTVMCLTSIAACLSVTDALSKRVSWSQFLWSSSCLVGLVTGRMAYITYIFYLIRYLAFMDTVVLVLRKKSIPFLHWYKHTFVVLMLWSWLEDQSLFGSIAMTIISWVHIFRYCRFVCISLGCETGLKKFESGLEVAQFIAGVILALHQMCRCPQSNGVLLSASINATMVYMVVRVQDKEVATTRGMRDTKCYPGTT